MSKIYWAGPLHDKEDRERNAEYVDKLRRAGHLVYVPQEHGIWEDLVKELGDETAVRKRLFKLDLKAMQNSDICIACCGDLKTPRGPSEGMLWEMGWMTAANKTVILFNEKNYWKYNLMPEFGSTFIFDNFEELLSFLEEEEHVGL